MLTTEQIDSLIGDTFDVYQRILAVDSLLLQIANPNLRQFYTHDLLEMIHYYNLMVNVLEKELHKYEAYERENNLPINLRYRKILGQLRNTTTVLKKR